MAERARIRHGRVHKEPWYVSPNVMGARSDEPGMTPDPHASGQVFERGGQDLRCQQRHYRLIIGAVSVDQEGWRPS